MGSFRLLAIRGRMQLWVSCWCRHRCHWRLCELVWMEPYVILAVHPRVRTVCFRTSGRNCCSSNGWLWQLVSMGISSFLAVRRRLCRLRGIGSKCKRPERNPTIRGSRQNFWCTVWRFSKFHAVHELARPGSCTMLLFLCHGSRRV